MQHGVEGSIHYCLEHLVLTVDQTTSSQSQDLHHCKLRTALSPSNDTERENWVILQGPRVHLRFLQEGRRGEVAMLANT